MHESSRSSVSKTLVILFYPVLFVTAVGMTGFSLRDKGYSTVPEHCYG